MTIIGGTDGPTSVFIAGRDEKKSLHDILRRKIYKLKRRRAAKYITAGTHTLRATIGYAKKKYHAKPIDENTFNFKECKRNLKESLVTEYKPELLQGCNEIREMSEYSEESIREYFNQLKLRSDWIADNISDEEISMDFHIYEIAVGDGRLQIEVDFSWERFGISYSGSKKAMKQIKRISKSLYRYYGVSKADIRDNTERYSALLTVLCE